MSALRIDVADLLAHRGARRVVRLEVPVDGLAVSGVRIEAPLLLDLLLERVPEGIVVRGAVHARWDAECGVCLRDLAAEIDVSVSELFEVAPVDGETYPIDGHVLDLDQLVRDAVLLDLPLVPTCAGVGLADCTPAIPLGDAFGAGAPGSRAPESGASAPDVAGDAPADPRWAVLSELEL